MIFIIAAIVALCVSNAKIVKNKGRKPGLFVFYTLLLGVGSFFVGSLLGALVLAATNSDTGAAIVIYVVWIVGIIMSGVIAKKAKPSPEFENLTQNKVNTAATQNSVQNQATGNQVDATWQPPTQSTNPDEPTES